MISSLSRFPASSTCRYRDRVRSCPRYGNEKDTTPAETPVDSPRSGSDSDAAYDTLRGVLGKVHLKKYFGEFRQREVRLEELKVLTESDLTEASPVCA